MKNSYFKINLSTNTPIRDRCLCLRDYKYIYFRHPLQRPKRSWLVVCI